MSNFRNKSRVFFSLKVIIIILFTLSCHRQDLEDYCYAQVLIPVTIDWSGAALDANNDADKDLYSASVWLFPTPDSEYQGDPLEFKLSDALGGVIAAPLGTFNILIFNKTVTDFSGGVGFRGTDKYETFEYYSNQDSTIVNPDILAVYSLENYSVTSDMIETPAVIQEAVESGDSSNLSEKLKELMGVMPQRLTHALQVTFYVSNIESAESGQTKFSGMGEAVKLSSGEVSESDVSHLLSLTQGSVTTRATGDALVGTTNLFGPLDDATYSLETQFTLVGEHEGSTTYPATALQHDVTDQISSTELGDDRTYYVNIGFEGDSIVLPEFNVGSGLDIEINDWEDDIVIPLY